MAHITLPIFVALVFAHQNILNNIKIAAILFDAVSLMLS